MAGTRTMLMEFGRLVLCIATSTIGAIVFGALFTLAFQLVAFGMVIFYLLLLGVFAGALGGPVFGVAYYVAIDHRHRTASRARSTLLAGVLSAVVFAAMGGGFHGWSEWEGAQTPAKTPTGRPAAGRAGSFTMRATPEGGETIEQQPLAEDQRVGHRILATAGTLAIAGFLYGALYGAAFARSRSSQETST